MDNDVNDFIEFHRLITECLDVCNIVDELLFSAGDMMTSDEQDNYKKLKALTEKLSSESEGE